jgi:hypothetical protein
MKVKIVCAILLASFISTAALFAEDEEIILTTYYPAPYGDYDGLGANSLAVGSNYAVPSTDGDVVIQGRVGIGTDEPFGMLGISNETSDSALSFGVHNNMPYIESISKNNNTIKRPLYLNAWGGNVGIGTHDPTALLEVGGLINAGLGSRNTFTGSNTDMGIRFFSKGANSTNTNLVHPAGRIYGHNFNSGWNSQILAIGVANNWNSFRDMIFLQGNGKMYLGENLPAASLGNETVNIGGNLFVSGDIRSGSNSSTLYVNALNGPNGGKLIGRTGHMITTEWVYPPGRLIFHVDKDENPSGTMSKTFVIEHPVDKSKHLVHAVVEGPESAVFYRGEAELHDGKAVVILPDYFEALTRKRSRTVQLTPKGKKPFGLSYEDIEDGRFAVYATEPNGRFSWEVKAVRADIEPLEAEISKRDVSVIGFGPYTYIADKTD